jgi:hypothetical protein
MVTCITQHHRPIRELSRSQPEETDMSQAIVECARAEALFVTMLQRSDHASSEQIRAAITEAVRRHGSRGCAALVAQEFGEHPDTAVVRMRWALDVTRTTFAKPAA